tara:strand:+ start:1637 stop:2647 length:1011 start_codon:yes stop_codon:yes gene_type:complete
MSTGAAALGASVGDDFPLVCDGCLGPNPYVRMIKTHMGRECKLSGRPFTSFRWQGERKRWKETCVSPEVAREKRVCQSCLLDLEYGVPFHVREHVLQALGEAQAPNSEVNREFHWANQRQKQADGDTGGGTETDTGRILHDNIDTLRALAAMDPGPVILPKRSGGPLSEDELAKLRERRRAELRPPADVSIRSLYLGSVPPVVGKAALLPYFLEYGTVASLTLEPTKLCGFVTYHRREDAERACAAINGTLVVDRSRVRVSWARRRNSRDTSAPKPVAHHPEYAARSASSSGARSATKRAGAPLLPPGVKLPPGVAQKVVYPSMDPNASGARPDVG